MNVTSHKPTDTLDNSIMEKGFVEALGCRLLEWREGYVVIGLDLTAAHLNSSGTVHGGVLATLIDLGCALPGLYAAADEPPRRATTLSMTTSFTGQVSTGRLRARGSLQRQGKRIYFGRTEIVDDDDNPIAHGEAVLRYCRGSGPDSLTAAKDN